MMRVAMRSRWAWMVAAVTAAVFARSLSASFIGLDDPVFILSNDHLRLASASDLRFIFGIGWVHWYPLTWLSLSLDRALWGLQPMGYHLTSVLLHALNAALAFLLISELVSAGEEDATGGAAAAFAALLFALHPLRVESVSWVTERSDVLCAAFILSSVLMWSRGRPMSSLFLHVLGLAAKGVGMTVPLVLLMLDALGLSRRPWPGWRSALWRFSPFLAFSAAAGALNMSAQNRFGAPWSLERLGVVERLAVGCWNYTHGLAATFWPSGLKGLYPMPAGFDVFQLRFVAAVIAVCALTVLAWVRRRRDPAWSAAWGGYILLMAPMAGFLKTGPQLMADRYTYLSTLGLAALAGAGFLRVLRSRRRGAVVVASLLIVTTLAGLTWRRQGDWLNNERFWSAEVRGDARDAIAKHFLGLERLGQGRGGEAESLVRAALALDPGLGPAHNSLANILARTGRYEEALPHYRDAMRLEPQAPSVRHNMAGVLIRLGRREEARFLLREELAMYPSSEVTRRLLDSLGAR